MPCFLNAWSATGLLRRAAALLLGLQLAACSHYSGPVSNAPDTTDLNGPPLLNNYYAP
jgi:hypothetical protein